MDPATKILVDCLRPSLFPELHLGRALYVHLLGQQQQPMDAKNLADQVRGVLKEAGLYERPDGKSAETMAVEYAFDSLVWDGFICHKLDGTVQLVGWGSVSPSLHISHFVAAARAGAVDSALALTDVLEWLQLTSRTRFAASRAATEFATQPSAPVASGTD